MIELEGSRWFRYQYMVGIGFLKSGYDDCVYIKKENGNIKTYLLLYVDDMLIAAANMEDISKLKNQLQSGFEIKDLGNVKT